MTNLSPVDLEHVVNSFSRLDDYDYFLFDTAAGISDSVISYSMNSSEVVLVITPEPTSIADAYAVVKVLANRGFKGQLKVVVNQCKNAKMAKQTFNHFHSVVKKFLKIIVKPLGYLNKDERIPESVRKQQPLMTLYPNSNVAKSIQIMASRLVSNDLEFFEQNSVGDFWSKLFEYTKGSLDPVSHTESQYRRS